MEQFILTPERTLSWAMYGAFFGYPPCCIAEFISTLKRPPRRLRGTGYIPCRKCNSAFTPKQLIARINQHRKCKIPFPHTQIDLPRFEEARLNRLRDKWATVGLPFTHKRLYATLGG